MKEISIELKIGRKAYSMIRKMPQTLAEAVTMFGEDEIFMWALTGMVAQMRGQERHRIIKGRHRRRPQMDLSLPENAPLRPSRRHRHGSRVASKR